MGTEIQDKTSEQAAVVLGKNTNYPTKYDPSQLVKIERKLNRETYGIENDKLEFIGFDVWNCYEMATMTESGEPVHFIGKMIVPVNSEYIVESKSMKLYTFSYNMSRFGKDPQECVEIVTKMISQDLSKLLECDVKFNKPEIGFENLYNSKFNNMMHLNFSNKFTEFNEEPLILRKRSDKRIEPKIEIRFDNFRSNCRVTNQPDFATIIIVARNISIDMKSLHEYLVSFRNEAHFHEEVIELIYTRLNSLFDHDGLLVIGFYTRRGGIDIVPVRASDKSILNDVIGEYRFDDPTVITPRMLQQ